MLYDRLNAEVKKGLNDELELYPNVNGSIIKSLKEADPGQIEIVAIYSDLR